MMGLEQSFKHSTVQQSTIHRPRSDETTRTLEALDVAVCCVPWTLSNAQLFDIACAGLNAEQLCD